MTATGTSRLRRQRLQLSGSRVDRPKPRHARPTRRTASRCRRKRRRAASTAGTSTTAPSAVSKQHSASVTARPPSAQSCADRISPLATPFDQHALQRRLPLEIELRRHAFHQPVDDLQILAAAQLVAALAEQHDRVAVAAERPADDGVRVFDQARRRRARASAGRPCRRSRCRG